MAGDQEQLFFKLGDIAEALGVEVHVLRFWEREFPQIKPYKIGSRKRLYRQRDLDSFTEIKRLLYEERFTIAGAKKRLERPDYKQGELFEDSAASPAAAQGSQVRPAANDEIMSLVRRELLAIREILSARTFRK